MLGCRRIQRVLSQEVEIAIWQLSFGIKDRKENIMSVPNQEDRLMQLAEDWYEYLVHEGWPKNDWETWSEARTRAKDEWEKGHEG